MGKNIVAECYQKATGCCAPVPGSPSSEGAAYMVWCEGKANKWRAACEEFGYSHPTFEIKTLHGSITYHDWLKREVGL